MTNSLPTRLAALAAAAAVLCQQGSPAAIAQSGQSIPGGFSRPASSQSAPAAAGAQSPWVKGHGSAARLIAGAEPAGDGRRRIVAGVEIRLDDGWKTYWRHPGDDGGLPPAFDWSGSSNLKSARVLFPAPQRIKSLNGTTLGYAKAVILPVEVEPVDIALPVQLVLALDYGVCREICVPAEARLSLSIAPGIAGMPADLARSLQRVPMPLDAKGASQALRAAKATLTGKSPAITLDIAGTAIAGSLDLHVEPPVGINLPVPARIGDLPGGAVRFRIDLKDVEGAAGLAGKPLRLTVTGADGGVELTWTVK